MILNNMILREGMFMQLTYKVDDKNTVDFNNNVDFCVGTGRMGLALQKEYMDQLRAVQEDIGFKHIRGHGIFSDDMAIYQEFKGKDGEVIIEYNFTYLDLVMDSYKEVGIKPFLELGFMPKKMASGEQTIFYWKGNVTPPKDYKNWCDLVVATLKHLMERYGKEEVVTWPIEVWNEPNLPGFWKDADMDEYFVLFENTFNAIKNLDERFKVGGPAICGVEDVKYMTMFMDFISEKKIPVDFITRHHYTSEVPDFNGHYGYIKLVELNESLETLNDSRRIIDSYPDYKGIQMHITEFNTSYIPNAPIHDTNQNAAYTASLLARLGETSESYSYWTFGDVFEEMGVPFAPFHGGFGMMANRGIKKPTYYAFKFFKQLKGRCVMKNDNCVICKEDDVYRGILFNSNVERTGNDLYITLEFEGDKERYSLIKRIVDEDTCNPLKLWHAMGEPSSLSKEQIKLLRESDEPLTGSDILVPDDKKISASFIVKEFGLIYFELRPLSLKADRGYDYDRVMS